MKIKTTSTFKLILLLICINNFQFVKAQVPQKMSYQAVLRNSNDALISNGQVGIKISILQGSAVGVSVYAETQTTTTNTNGLISIIIGNGNVISGELATINWATGNYYIKSEIDPSGGSNYTIEGSSQLLSVPYSLYSANGPPGPAGTFPQGTDIGDMQYWNGTNWTMIPVGSAGQFLQLNSSNIPQWSGPRFATLNTLPITNISQFGSISGVNVIDDGGYPLLKNGICYSETPNPTIYSYKVGASLIIGSQQIGIGYYDNTNGGFSGSNPLLPNTTYYVRAYAENLAGLVYGNQQTFTTTADVLPTVSTSPVINVLAYTATLNGSSYYQTPQGSSVKGFCYSVTPNPTILNTVINMGSGNGTFTYSLSGLSASTTYYVRAFSTNSNGTQYGEEQVFTTCITPSFSIGQSYAGGQIFYIDCTGQHGLVVANPSSGLLPWGCYGTDINTTSGVNTGQSNTNLIISNCATINNAAYFCDNLTLNGYSDWFLPSIDELMMIKNTNTPLPGVFWCWSSTQVDSLNAYGINIGPQAVSNYNPKNYSLTVIAVRAF